MLTDGQSMDEAESQDERGAPSESRTGVLVSAPAEHEELVKKAMRFAQEHEIPFDLSPSLSMTQLVLAFTPNRVEVRDLREDNGPGFSVDFTGIDLRTGTGNLSRKQPLPRAIGKETKTVVDATAGLGHDAVLLACMGYDVIAVERSPIVAALLLGGLITSPATAEPPVTEPAIHPVIEIGKPFPVMKFPSLADERATGIEDFKGQKVVLHVFASW